ncbi:MAG: hypothetical protein WA624_13000 [Methylocella sp.]
MRMISRFVRQSALAMGALTLMISTQALAFKAIRRLYPDYPLWRDFAYEYEQGKLAIDVINGGPLLRDWGGRCTRDGARLG